MLIAATLYGSILIVVFTLWKSARQEARQIALDDSEQIFAQTRTRRRSRGTSDDPLVERLWGHVQTGPRSDKLVWRSIMTSAGRPAQQRRGQARPDIVVGFSTELSRSNVSVWSDAA